MLLSALNSQDLRYLYPTCKCANAYLVFTNASIVRILISAPPFLIQVILQILTPIFQFLYISLQLATLYFTLLHFTFHEDHLPVGDVNFFLPSFKFDAGLSSFRFQLTNLRYIFLYDIRFQSSLDRKLLELLTFTLRQDVTTNKSDVDFWDAQRNTYMTI